MSIESVRKQVRMLSLQILLVWVGEFVACGVFYVIARQAIAQAGSGAMELNRNIGMGLVVVAGASLLAGLYMRCWRY